MLFYSDHTWIMFTTAALIEFLLCTSSSEPSDGLKSLLLCKKASLNVERVTVRKRRVPPSCLVSQGWAQEVSSAGFHSLWTCRKEYGTFLAGPSPSAPAQQNTVRQRCHSSFVSVDMLANSTLIFIHSLLVKGFSTFAMVVHWCCQCFQMWRAVSCVCSPWWAFVYNLLIIRCTRAARFKLITKVTNYKLLFTLYLNL